MEIKRPNILETARIDHLLALASTGLEVAIVDANVPKVRTSVPPSSDDHPNLPFNHLG